MLLKGYLTVEKVAKQLGLSEYRVRELIREKQIRAVKIGQEEIKGDGYIFKRLWLILR
jgi:excisionase family DNA binding protein